MLPLLLLLLLLRCCCVSAHRAEASARCHPEILFMPSRHTYTYTYTYSSTSMLKNTNAWDTYVMVFARV